MAKYICPVCKRPSESPEGCFLHKKRKPLKSKPLQRHPASPEQKTQDLLDQEKMWELFKEIWAERPHISEVSGTPIRGEILSVYFDHAAPKETYPEHKFKKENIILVTFHEHTLRHRGFALPEHTKKIEEIYKILGIT